MWRNCYRVYKSKYDIVQLSENFFSFQIVIIGAVSLFDEEEKVIKCVANALIILVLIAFCGFGYLELYDACQELLLEGTEK